MEEGTPGEVVITGETQQGTGRTRQEEANVMERPAKEQKQMGLHNTFLHKLREEKGKREETEMANMSQRESGENGNERARVQTDLRMYMSPMADMKRKPRTDGGPNEPAPDEELKETADPGTTEGEEGGERKEGGSSTKHPNEKLQIQMPVTEKRNAGTALTEPRKCRLNALTWNIQGNEEALYDLEPALEKWDIDLAILTEIKSASRGIQHRCNAKHSAAYCTDVPAEKLRRHRKKVMYRGGVGIILRGGLAHKHAHTEIEVPGLRGYVAHMVLHLPGDKHVHVLGIYNPPDSEEDETRAKVRM